MASQLVATPHPGAKKTPHAGANDLTVFQRFIRLVVRRRVPISVLLFTALVAIDLLVLHSRPRDVLNVADPFAACGLLFVIGGLLVRTWAAGTLRKRRELATTGPYAWIRHPLYFGSFLMMVGFGTLVHDPLTLWVVVGPVAWLYWQAVKSEEKQIAKLFPAQWPAYAASVPRFFPRRLLVPRLHDWSLGQWLRNSEYQAWIGSVIAIAGIQVWHLWR